MEEAPAFQRGFIISFPYTLTSSTPAPARPRYTRARRPEPAGTAAQPPAPIPSRTASDHTYRSLPKLC